MQQALARIRSFSADAETQRLAFVRERALRDQRSELLGAREEGIAQGEATILERQLRRRFGPVSEATRTRLRPPPPRNSKPGPSACSMRPIATRSSRCNEGGGNWPLLMAAPPRRHRR